MANLNIYPVTSNEYIEEKMKYITPIIEKQVSEMAASRGLDPNDPIVKKAIQDELDKYRQDLISKSSEYQFQETEAEKSRASQEKMAKEQAKAQERGAMWQGLGQLGGMALFSGKDNILSKGVSSGFNALKSAYNTPSVEYRIRNSPLLSSQPIQNNKSVYDLSNLDNTLNNDNRNIVDYEQYKTNDYLTKGLPALGSLAGWLVNKGKGASQAGWLGGLSSMASTSPYAGIGTFLGSALAPKEGLFKKSSHFGKSLLSTLGSTTPIWGRLVGLF